MVLHLPRLDGVQNSLNNFDLDPVTSTFDHVTWTLTFDTVTLTYYLYLLPTRSVGATVQPAGCKRTDRQTQTHTHTQ